MLANTSGEISWNAPEGRQRAQGPGHGQRVQPGPLGQFRRRERTGVEVIRHAALDERPEHWRQIEVREQAKGLEERLGRRRSIRLGGRNVAQLNNADLEL